MAMRKIVHIDEAKCNGCGLCIPNCAEGALKIIDGKAKLVKDIYCDGLGACLGHCPTDAIEIIERDAAEFDEAATHEYLKGKTDAPQIGDLRSSVRQINLDEKPKVVHQGGCPGSRMRQFGNKAEEKGDNVVTSKLKQWPVQLMLVPTNAPYFRNADLLITADCVPFAYGNYHNDFLKDKSVVVGCPKLDDIQHYIEKLTEIMRGNDLESITVLKMEVPCCSGMASAAKNARDKSGCGIPIKVITIGIEGDIIKREYI